MSFRKSIALIILSFVIICINSCSKENSFNPENQRCDVIAVTNLQPYLPCSVKYYANVYGGMKNVSLSYYIDSGKVINVNPSSFPFEEKTYLTIRDTARITGTGITNQSGSLIVSFYAWKTGFASFGSDSCVK